MSDLPLLPPVYDLMILQAGTDPLAAAAALCKDSVTDGAVHLVTRPDRLQFAVTLEPETKLEKSLQVAIVGMVAMGDAIGTVIPAAIPVSFGWPTDILVNEARVGRMGLAVDTKDPKKPRWMVLAFDIAIHGPGAEFAGDPGLNMRETTLAEEGAPEATPPVLLESFTRTFLNLVARWEDDGFAATRATWNAKVRSKADVIDDALKPRVGDPLVKIARRPLVPFA